MVEADLTKAEAQESTLQSLFFSSCAAFFMHHLYLALLMLLKQGQCIMFLPPIRRQQFHTLSVTVMSTDEPIRNVKNGCVIIS